jgi:predicted HicB family RNase H-like nuclease
MTPALIAKRGDARMSVRVSARFRTRLAAVAKRNGRSLNTQVVYMLRKAMGEIA